MSTRTLVSYFLPLVLLGLVFCFFAVKFVSAQTILQSDLDGYAWSSTIGWISLNCRTGGPLGGNICPTSNYKVSINSDRTITGYAWSSNIGWIKFGGLSSFPTGGGTVAVNARVTGATYPNLSFEGWARACAGTTTGTCSVMTDSPSGWDGWISLNGTNYGISTDNNGFVATPVASASYAWGSTVIGWIDWFSEAEWLKPTGSVTSVGTCTVPEGGSTCLAPVSWTITYATDPNIRNNSTADHYSSSSSGTNINYPIRLGTNTIVVRDGSTVLDTFSRTLTATNCQSGTVIVGSTCEFPPPTITIAATKPIVRKGSTVDINWTISPNPLPASSVCTLGGPGLSGTVTVSGNRSSAALNSTSIFRISCSSASYGTVEATVRVDMIPTSQEV